MQKKMYKKYDKLDFSSTDYTTLNQIIYHVRKMQICKNHANFDMRNKRNIQLIILMMNFCKSTSILWIPIIDYICLKETKVLCTNVLF